MSHLAQMKSVYPEVISLRYASIPKTSMQDHCSGPQLIIDMSLSDSAAEPASTLKAAPSQSAEKHPTAGNSTLQQKVSSRDSPAAQTAPSSTQAAIKAGGPAAAEAVLCHGQQSVNKADAVVGEEVGKKGQAVESPGEPLRMMAVKAEFERRLEKQVDPTSIKHCRSSPFRLPD